MEWRLRCKGLATWLMFGRGPRSELAPRWQEIYHCSHLHLPPAQPVQLHAAPLAIQCLTPLSYHPQVQYAEDDGFGRPISEDFREHFDVHQSMPYYSEQLCITTYSKVADLLRRCPCLHPSLLMDELETKADKHAMQSWVL